MLQKQAPCSLEPRAVFSDVTDWNNGMEDDKNKYLKWECDCDISATNYECLRTPVLVAPPAVGGARQASGASALCGSRGSWDPASP